MPDDDLQPLIDEWGEGNVQAAFWLQRHIKETGLDGIGYMDAARNHLHSTGEFTVRQKLNSQMDDNY